MTDFERIRLVGGPHNNVDMKWDGGDYVTLTRPLPTTLLSNATKAFRDLMVTTHSYRRDPTQRDVFRWMGEN